MRCVQVGFNLADLDALDMGTVFDVLTESGNDNETYEQVATQADFDNF